MRSEVRELISETNGAGLSNPGLEGPEIQEDRRPERSRANRGGSEPSGSTVCPRRAGRRVALARILADAALEAGEYVKRWTAGRGAE